MPLVFIHGVRQRNESGLNRLVHQLELVVSEVRKEVKLPARFTVSAPYWGGDGVDPVHTGLNPATAWARDGREALEATEQGGEAADALRVLYDACAGDLDAVLELIKRHATTPQERAQLERLLGRDLEALYSEAAQAPLSMAPEPEDDFLERNDSVLIESGALSRFSHAVQRAASSVALQSPAVRAWVDDAQRNFALFMGDAMKYVLERERLGADSPILRKVLDALPEKQDGEPLVVMTHSMAGAILYDIMTYYRPDLRVDCWISVGGQVAQFHNLKLLKCQDLRSDAKGLAAPRVGKWFNICDTLDVMCFLANPVFPEAEDIDYRTSRGPLGNHSWYFREQTFYDLAAKCMVRALRP